MKHSNILRQFIREELAWNYWMRRPRNSIIPDVSSELEDMRAGPYDDAVDDFNTSIDGLRRAISLASSVDDIEDAFVGLGLDAHDIVQDPDALDAHVTQGGIEALKTQLLSDIDKWARDMKMSSQADQDTQALRLPGTDPGV